jgi:hypothetical protein
MPSQIASGVEPAAGPLTTRLLGHQQFHLILQVANPAMTSSRVLFTMVPSCVIHGYLRYYLMGLSSFALFFCNT